MNDSIVRHFNEPAPVKAVTSETYAGRYNEEVYRKINYSSIYDSDLNETQMIGLMRTLCIFAAVFITISTSVSANDSRSQQPIVFGVFPYVSSEKLVNYHRPLKALISQTLGHPVTLVSAPDFATFIENTRRGNYDYILTAPHLARLAEVESGFRRIAYSLHDVLGVYLVRKDSKIENLNDLEGKSIMVAQRLSLLYQITERQLREIGLEDGVNLTILETGTHNNAMGAPLREEADAALIGIRVFSHLNRDQNNQLRVIGKTPSAPGLMLMAHSSEQDDDVARVRDAVTTYADSRAGERYFARTGSVGFGLIKDSLMRSLDSFIDIAKCDC